MARRTTRHGRRQRHASSCLRGVPGRGGARGARSSGWSATLLGAAAGTHRRGVRSASERRRLTRAGGDRPRDLPLPALRRVVRVAAPRLPARAARRRLGRVVRHLRVRPARPGRPRLVSSRRALRLPLLAARHRDLRRLDAPLGLALGRGASLAAPGGAAAPGDPSCSALAHPTLRLWRGVSVHRRTPAGPAAVDPHRRRPRSSLPGLWPQLHRARQPRLRLRRFRERLPRRDQPAHRRPSPGADVGAEDDNRVFGYGLGVIAAIGIAVFVARVVARIRHPPRL